MSIINKLKSEGVVPLHHVYRNGHLLDSSGNHNNGYFDPTFPNTWHYTNTGLKLTSAYSKIIVADSPVIRLEEMTFIFYNKDGFVQQDDYFPRLVSNKGVDIYLRNADQISIAGSSINAPVNGKKCIGIYTKDGEASDLYLEGLYNTSGGVASITTNTNELYIGNLASGRRMKEGFSEVLIINRKLTATEQAQVCGELANTEYPTIKEAKILDSDPNELEDGDMEEAGVADWLPISCTRAKTTSEVYSGKQSLEITGDGTSQYPYVYQVKLVVGKTYRVTGCMKTGTAPSMSIKYSAGSGIYATTGSDWECFDETFTAQSVLFLVQLSQTSSTSTETGYVNDLKVTEIGKEYVDKWKTEWGVYTNGRQEFCTDGEQVNNTPFYSDAGDFRVTMDSLSTNKKDIEYALDFNSGWTATGGVVVDDANSFTRTGSGAISSDGNIFETGRRYKIRIAGTKTASELRFYNNQGSSYRMTSYVTDNTFDVTFDYTARTPWLMFYVTDNGTVNIDTLVIEEYDQDIKVLECVDFSGGTLKFPDWLGDSDITGYEYDVASEAYTKGTLSVSSGIYTMDWGDKIALSDMTGNNSIIKQF